MTSAVRALIVDDEAPGRANLRHALAGRAEWTVAAECASAEAARRRLEQDDIDVVFLDVQMPEETGLDLARGLSAQDEPPLVIFVTAHHDRAVEAFEVHALDFLLKPFDDERLTMALERARAMLDLRQRRAYGQAMRDFVSDTDRGQSGGPAWLARIGVRSLGRIESVAVDDILWIASAGNYVELRMGGRTVLHRMTLGQLEQRLDPARFVRVHRSAMVRRDQARALQVTGDGAYALTLRNGDVVSVSERHVAAVRAMLQA